MLGALAAMEATGPGRDGGVMASSPARFPRVRTKGVEARGWVVGCGWHGADGGGGGRAKTKVRR